MTLCFYVTVDANKEAENQEENILAELGVHKKVKGVVEHHERHKMAAVHSYRRMVVHYEYFKVEVGAL